LATENSIAAIGRSNKRADPGAVVHERRGLRYDGDHANEWTPIVVPP
jgi:hypothetical protein